MTKDEALKDLLDAVEAAIKANDWVVDGACDPDLAIRRAKQAMAQPEQEPMAWRNAAIRVGEDLSSVGPHGYYDMTAQQWLDWAMEQQPQGKNSLTQQEACAKCKEWEAVCNQHLRHIKKIKKQHTWVGLTRKEAEDVVDDYITIGGDVENWVGYWQAIEAKLKEKNT